MTDYFFASTPLHFLISANIAIAHADNESVLIIMSRNAKVADRFRIAAEKHPDIFDRVVTLPHEPRKSRNARSPRFSIIHDVVSRTNQARIFTGNDRRLEFQYAMHVASTSDSRPEGIYMDEGAVTYFGHKSMGSFVHRYVDPLLKRLFVGQWYKPALTTGASDWVQTIYAAFPDQVHPLLRNKKRVKIDPGPFSQPQFKALARDLLADDNNYEQNLRDTKIVVTLPHEGSYVDSPEIYEAVGRVLLTHYSPSQVAIKPHPRVTNRKILAQLFPGATLLEPTTGMEVLLPLLNNDCLVAGDISSTLLTTKWLRPSLPVVALNVHTSPPERMIALYKTLNIPMVAPERLATWLQSATPIQ